MLKLIGCGLINFGWNIKINTDDKLDNLRKNIKNEKIYVYPNDVFKLCEEQTYIPDNIIVKIPHNLIDNKYFIGMIKLNIMIKKTSTIFKFDENGRIKIINNDKIKKEPFQTYLLFPTKIFKEFELEQKMFESNKIKILFNNTITSKSIGYNNLFERYFNVVKNSGMDCFIHYHSIPSIHSIALSEYDFELEENFIRSCNNVYLIVNPHKQMSEPQIFQEQPKPNIKLNIIAIADNKDKIIKEKYCSKINEIISQYSASFLVIACGIGLLFYKQ